ncbi:elongation factor P [Desulfoglaeba alkanexedens]|jgi:elongation factor P|uniref:Elongation factor P n=1 Tax=Desulfoglaeba alkanexedens ALDC TaxID=980445 RepID=A0A4P8L2B5_9BACT|nr:elongation factor P [Desulfoglaeba alkanexedens]QCQ20872.1 elongation factor P [Desulfoglaeba alkanexedens ALDC]
MGAVLTSSDLRKGLKLEIDGEPYVIVDFEFSKPGKGQALYRCRLRNMVTGVQFDRTYRSGDKHTAADLDERKMEYLYKEGDHYCFMNTESFEQIELNEAAVGDAKNFLTENLVVDMLFFKDTPIGITLPNFVELPVVKADPGVKGDTASGATKPVTLSTGYEVQVPLFIEEGDILKLDTRTGAYVERIKSSGS